MEEVGSEINMEQNEIKRYSEEHYITEVEINDLRKYMAECIKKLNKVVRINLRNAILRRLYFLEWRYEE